MDFVGFSGYRNKPRIWSFKEIFSFLKTQKPRFLKPISTALVLIL